MRTTDACIVQTTGRTVAAAVDAQHLAQNVRFRRHLHKRRRHDAPSGQIQAAGFAGWLKTQMRDRTTLEPDPDLSPTNS